MSAREVGRAEVEDFLFREAALLDEWRLDEWLAHHGVTIDPNGLERIDGGEVQVAAVGRDLPGGRRRR